MSLLTGLGALTGAFSNSPANKTTTTSGSQNYSTSGTSTSSQNLTPYQSSLQAPLFSYIQNLMTPAGAQAAVQPFTQASMDSTNSTYAGLGDTLRQQFLTTGNGQSGKYGNAMVQGNLQRLGALQGVQNTGQEEAAALPLQASSLATNLLEHPFGSTTSTSGTGTQNFDMTKVGPGSPLAGALQGGTAALTGQSNMMNSIIAAMLMNGG
jgi:hypothetical protein